MASIIWKNTTVKLSDLRPWQRNPRRINAKEAERLAQSFDEFGQVETIAIGPDNEVYNGHQRLTVLLKKHGPDYEIEARQSSRALTEKEREKLTVYLHRGAAGEWDIDALAGWDAGDLVEWGFDADEVAGWGEVEETQQSDAEPQTEAARQTLAERFGVPPFSVLDARQGYWQSRKQAWLGLGISPVLGRDGEDGRAFVKHNATDPVSIKILDQSNGTSTFDPVLCELVYRWFNVPSGAILDPFGGESTKGIVAAHLNYSYTGVELREEQVNVNKIQWDEVSKTKEYATPPTWICGDSEQIDQHLSAGAKYDLVFTSPPYYDLEIYSESEKDGSAFETYEKFIEWYKAIFAQCVDRMNDNRFLVVKIGEIRDKKTGAYRNFVGDNIRVFSELGLHYYNEIILVTAVGSLALRAGKQFSTTRKIGKTHQNILVFYKGDLKRINSEYPDNLEFGEVEQEADPPPPNATGTIKIKVSAKSARELWNGCQTDYINTVCGGRCCKTGGGQSHIAILPEEEEAIRHHGGEVENGMLVNRPGGGCPFWEKGLCKIHFTGAKPLTCWTSPFTLNANNTLIVKNRSRKLICYKADPKLETYKAYRRSLVEMFGEDVAAKISEKLDAGSGDFHIDVSAAAVNKIQWIVKKTKESLIE